MISKTEIRKKFKREWKSAQELGSWTESWPMCIADEIMSMYHHDIDQDANEEKYFDLWNKYSIMSEELLEEVVPSETF